MLRTLTFTSLIAASLLSATAYAAEAGAPLVNRPDDATAVYGGSRNIVGGARRNPDGSVTYLHQPSRPGGPADPIADISQQHHQAW